MPTKTLYRAILYACVPAVSLSLHAASVSYNAIKPSELAQPALAALVRETLESNPGVLAAQAAVDAARARISAADRPLYNPELGLDLEKAETDTGALGISQTIDWADKREARTQVATFERTASRARLAATRQQLAGELLLALARFQTAGELTQLAEQRADLMRRFASLSEQRQLAGDLSQVELEVAKLAYVQAQLRRAQVASDVIEARQALVAVAGHVDRDWPALPANLPKRNDKTFNVEALLNKLPILRAQRAQIAAARAAVELQVRQRRADPTVGLRGGREENDTVVGINLNLPLFVRNTFSAEVDVANAELIQTQSQAQDIYRRTRAQLISALQQYRVTYGARQAWEQTGRQSLRMQIDLLRRFWQAGELSTTDFLVQLNQALDTQASAIEVRGRAWQAWFTWLTASARIDDWLGLGKL